MKIFRLFILCQILIFSSCSKDQLETPAVNHCSTLADAKRLTLEERANACIYSDIFIYQDKIYTICECCVCDKIYQIVDCEGNDLLANFPNRIADFRLNARYLFSIEGF